MIRRISKKFVIIPYIDKHKEFDVMKKKQTVILIAIVLLGIVGTGAFYLLSSKKPDTQSKKDSTAQTTTPPANTTQKPKHPVGGGTSEIIESDKPLEAPVEGSSAAPAPR